MRIVEVQLATGGGGGWGNGRKTVVFLLALGFVIFQVCLYACLYAF